MIMTTEQYNFAVKRIIELQNPALDPLGCALQYELDELMLQVQNFEDARDAEAVAEYEFMQRFEECFQAHWER